MKNSKWIGKKVQGWYPAPADTCCNNGKRIRYEGIVSSLGRHTFLGNCLRLKRSDGSGELYVRPEEFTSVDGLEVERGSQKMT
jgi:hypothetical protein